MTDEPRSHGQKRRQAPGATPADGDRRLSDRRAKPRVAIEVWVEERKDKEVYYLRTADISEGGAFIEGSIPYSPGTLMELHIPLPGFVPFVVQAEVVTSGDDRGELGMGVKFVDPAFDLVAAVKSLAD